MWKKKPSIACPKCGATAVKAVEDKTEVLSYVGHVPIYKKKHVCKACSFEFPWEPVTRIDET